MSLDIYLQGEPQAVECRCSCCDNVHERIELPDLFSANITHNLGRMADAAGIYDCLWRPDENGITKAEQMILPLRKGLAELERDPDYFATLNASNGWGTYEQFIPWIKRLLAACVEYPEGNVRVSR